MQLEEEKAFNEDIAKFMEESAGNFVRVSQRLKTRLLAKLNGKETFSERLKREFKAKKL